MIDKEELSSVFAEATSQIDFLLSRLFSRIGLGDMGAIEEDRLDELKADFYQGLEDLILDHEGE